MTKDTCCGARCRHCDVWQTLDIDEPPTAWCDRCRATTYCDERGCIPCASVKQDRRDELLDMTYAALARIYA